MNKDNILEVKDLHVDIHTSEGLLTAVRGVNFEMKKGDLLLINPLELHQPRISEAQNDYERIVLWINKDFLFSLSSNYSSLSRCFDNTNPDHTNLLRLSFSSQEMLNNLLTELITRGLGELRRVALPNRADLLLSRRSERELFAFGLRPIVVKNIAHLIKVLTRNLARKLPITILTQTAASHIDDGRPNTTEPVTAVRIVVRIILRKRRNGILRAEGILVS